MATPDYSIDSQIFRSARMTGGRRQTDFRMRTPAHFDCPVLLNDTHIVIWIKATASVDAYNETCVRQAIS